MTYLDAASRELVCLIKTGTYVGDGAANRGITGIGFQPTFVRVSPVLTDGDATEIFEKVAGMGLITDHHQTAGSFHHTHLNHVISLDADGFTVGDDEGDEHPNANGVTYTYLALGTA